MRTMLLVLALAVLASACSDEKVASPGGSAVARVALDPAAAVVAVGDSLELEARPLAEDGAPVQAEVVWSLSGDDVASLRAVKGRAFVRGQRAGTVVVAAAAGGRSGTATLTVLNPVPQAGRLEPAGARTGMAGLEVSVLGSHFMPGVQATFAGHVRPTHRVSAGELKVQLFPADLDQAGEFAIVVSNPLPGGGAAAPLTFTLSAAPVASVTLEAPAGPVLAGQTLQLVARAWDAFGAELDRPFTWASTNPAVAQVNAWGTVYGVAAGVSVISASVEGRQASVQVTVETSGAPAPEISALVPASIPALRDTVITIRGQHFAANAAVFWNGAGHYAEVVSPTELRVEIGGADVRYSGKLAVRVFSPGAGMSAPDTLVITPALLGVRIDRVLGQLLPGESTPYVAVALDDHGQPMPGKTAAWASDQPGIARVDAHGIVTGVAPGSTVIRAVIEGRMAAIEVRVITAPAYDLLVQSELLGIPELFVRRLDGSGSSTRLMPGRYAADPAVSRDGARIAFVGRDGEGNLDIYVADRNGGNVQRLTSDPAVDDQPAWSPDGTRLVFRSERGNRSHIWIMNADGTGQASLTGQGYDWGTLVHQQPTFTADGTRVAFTRYDGSMSPADPAILTIRPDGSDPRVLTDPAGASDRDPAFSPDGQLLALSRRANGVDFLRLFSADGITEYVTLQPHPGTRPAFAPDSRWIVYQRTEANGSFATWITRADGADIQKLAVFNAVRAAWLPRD